MLEYFKPFLDDLCDDCKCRYQKNPLRLLDCKIDSNSEIMKNAPKICDYLNEESRDHFKKVKKYLDVLDIEYIVNDNLVRGLDYYTHTVFEVEADIKGFGSQNVLGAGGRYNNLVETIGGPKTSGVGFAIGIERLLLALDAEGIDVSEKESLDIYAMSFSEEQKEYLLKLANYLRLNGFNVEVDYMGRNLKNNFKTADRLEAKYIIIIGEDEIKNNVITVKNNKTKEEFKVKSDELLEFLDDKLGDE